MAKSVRAGLIQAGMGDEPAEDVARSKKYMLDKHVSLIEQAAEKGVQVLCLQEIFNGPYFCAVQDKRWYAMAE